jgi:hypothetical protein
MFDLMIRGGDVVTPEGVVRCDVAVAGETIATRLCYRLRLGDRSTAKCGPKVVTERDAGFLRKWPCSMRDLGGRAPSHPDSARC